VKQKGLKRKQTMKRKKRKSEMIEKLKSNASMMSTGYSLTWICYSAFLNLSLIRKKLEVCRGDEK
jgi:hypothetical protein